MSLQTADITPQSRFLRSRPGWTYWVRRYEFLGGALALIVLYAFLVLPDQGRPTSPGHWSAIAAFLALVMVWCAIVLTDNDKPDWLKGLVAIALIGVLGWLFYMYSGTKWDRLISSFFNFRKMRGAWPELLKGLLVTLQLAVISAIFAVLIGLVVAVLRSLGSRTLNIFLIAYLDIFRSIPMIVLMVVIYYALPYLGIALPSIPATIAALALGYGAYAAETFRAGIESVHYGQTEAARALGLTRLQNMRLVILPQAIRVVIPPLTGVMIALLKDTAVASVVAAPELLKRAREVYVGKANPTALVMAAIIYLIILFPLARLSNLLEARLREKLRRR